MQEREYPLETFELAPMHEKILYAEKHKKNYDIYFSVQVDPTFSNEDIHQAIHHVMNAIHIFKYTIMQEGARYRFRCDKGPKSFRSYNPLKNIKIEVFNGDMLARYFMDEDKHRVEFLIHHLILDGDSLYLFLDYIEQALVTQDKLSFHQFHHINDSHAKMLEREIRPLHAYFMPILRLSQQSQDIQRLGKPEYGKRVYTEHAFDVINSLSQKLRLTKFGVMLFATALLNSHKPTVVGIVVSRKDKRTQSDVVGNFTDVVPYLLQIDPHQSYIDNAKKIFRDLFTAVSCSADLSYDQYMKVLGIRGYDHIMSYTKMNQIEKNSVIFSNLELGEYLYKYDNHIQFNEYDHDLSVEFRYDNVEMQQFDTRIEALLEHLNEIDLTAPIDVDAKRVIKAITKEKTIQTNANISIDSLFPDVDENKSIFDSEISSLDIVRIITDVYEHFGIQLSYQDIYTSSSIKELKQQIRFKVSLSAQEEAGLVIEDHYICPNYIKTIFIDSFRFHDSPMYDVKFAYRLNTDIQQQLPKFIQAVTHVIQNNEVFNTSFGYADGQVIGTVLNRSDFNLEQVEVETMEEIQQWANVLRIQGKQKLWDIKIIQSRMSRETYLYMNMHHMIIDHIGIGVFLRQIETHYHQVVTPTYAQYRTIANHEEKAKAEAIQSWQSLLEYRNYSNQGKAGLAQGKFQTYTFDVSFNKHSFDELEQLVVTQISNCLAAHFQCEEGYIGAVYHGRVVPYADQVIGSFARVLPLFFCSRDSKVMEHSLHVARQHQAASIYDLNENGFSLAFPKIVFQTLLGHVDEGSLFNQTMEFEAISKFQLMFNLVLRDQGCQLHMYIDQVVFDADEEQMMVVLIQEGLKQLSHAVGEEILC